MNNITKRDLGDIEKRLIKKLDDTRIEIIAQISAYQQSLEDRISLLEQKVA